VTLHRKDAPLVDTLREIGVQVGAGGVTLSGDNLADKFEWVDSARVSLDIEKLDYWSALRAIRNQLGFVADLPILNFHRPREKEGYLSADPKQMPYDAEGAIVTGPLLITRQLEARGENLLLTLRVIPEAKVYESLSETGRYAILQIDEYTDDQGRSLLPSGQALVFPSITSGFDRAWQWRIDALLPRPAATRRIGSLKARIGVSVGPPQTELAAVDLTRGTGQLFEFDGVGVLVTSVVPSESTYTVTGEIIAPTNSPVGRALSDVDGGGANYLGLRDKTGAQILRDLGPSSVRSEAGVTTLTWTLKGRALRQPDGIPRSGPPPGGSIIVCNANCVPVALYWVTPSNTHWFYTPFEMRNVAVPAAGR
jgi:hypothetical protein